MQTFSLIIFMSITYLIDNILGILGEVKYIFKINLPISFYLFFTVVSDI